jgi:hypothetical protein
MAGTSLASHVTVETSLAEALAVHIIRAYTRRATGKKFAINPSLPARYRLNPSSSVAGRTVGRWGSGGGQLVLRT